jgi:predicted nucleic acid-binding protein
MPEQKALVINTGPLIALVAATGDLETLRNRYARIVVPFEVAREILAGGESGFAVPEFQKADFLDKQSHPIAIGTFLQNSLDNGEASVIQTALDLSIATVCIDEAVGRRVARLNGLVLTGSLGILLRAKQDGAPISIRTAIDNMQRHRIRISKELAAAAIKMAGE